MRQLILDIRPEAPPSLDNYLPGGNREALQRLRQTCAGEGGEPIVYLWGPAGVGKTHLLCALVSAWPGTAVYVPAGKHLPGKLDGLVAVDDAHCLGDTSQVALFNLLNAARDGQGMVVAAGGAAPAHLPLRPDVATRLGWGLVYALTPLSDTDKLAAVAERARARGMRWPDELGQYLIHHCRRDLPHLLAQVDALDRYSLSLGRPVTLALLRAMLAVDEAR